jgi:hypothetical protein
VPAKALPSDSAETCGSCCLRYLMFYFYLKMPIGEYSKNNFLQRTYENFDDYFDKGLGIARLANSAVSGVSGLPSKAADVLRTGYQIGQYTEDVLPAISKLEGMAEMGSSIGTAGNVIGGVLGGVSLGHDIAKAIETKHVSFDDAMKMADDGTAVVSSAVSFIPVVGGPLALGLNLGEKVVTGAIKADRAVKERKKELGVKHLGYNEWVNTVAGTMAPSWMSKDLKDVGKDVKAKLEKWQSYGDMSKWGKKSKKK